MFACSELLPEEVRKPGLGLWGGAEQPRPLLVLMMLRPLALFSLCGEVPTCTCPVPLLCLGLWTLAWPLGPQKRVWMWLLCLPFQNGGEGIALGDSKWHIPLRRCGIQRGPLRLAASLQGYLPV